MTVNELIATLQSRVEVDAAFGESEMIAEGCDCASEVVGYSVDKRWVVVQTGRTGPPVVVIRIAEGAYTGDGLEIVGAYGRVVL